MGGGGGGAAAKQWAAAAAAAAGGAGGRGGGGGRGGVLAAAWRRWRLCWRRRVRGDGGRRLAMGDPDGGAGGGRQPGQGADIGAMV